MLDGARDWEDVWTLQESKELPLPLACSQVHCRKRAVVFKSLTTTLGWIKVLRNSGWSVLVSKKSQGEQHSIEGWTGFKWDTLIPSNFIMESDAYKPPQSPYDLTWQVEINKISFEEPWPWSVLTLQLVHVLRNWRHMLAVRRDSALGRRGHSAAAARSAAALNHCNNDGKFLRETAALWLPFTLLWCQHATTAWDWRESRLFNLCKG